MAITKETEIAKIEVVGQYKAVQIATDTVIKEDDKKYLEAGIDTLKVRFDPKSPDIAVAIRNAAPNTFMAFSCPLISADCPAVTPLI